MGRGPKSNLGYHVYQEDPTHHPTPVPAAIPRNASGRIDEKSLGTLPTPSPTPLRVEESDRGDDSNLLEIIVPLPPLKRSASKTSHIPTGKRAKTKSSGGVPSRPAQLLATGEAPQDAASIRTRTANLMGLNKDFNSPQLSLSMTKPSIAEIPKQAIQVTTTPEDAISTTRSALTAMKSAIGKKDKASVEKHLLVAMGTLLSLYEGHFASSETGGVREAMERYEGVPKAHLEVIEKDRNKFGKETLRTSVSGIEGIEGSSPEGKLAEPAGSLSRPKNTDSVTPPNPKPTTAPLHRQDIIIKEQENRIKVLQDNLRKVRTELSESRKQNKEWFGKVASLEQEAGNNKSDVAREIAERTIGVLKEEQRLLDVQVVQLRELLEDKRKAVVSAVAASSASRRATNAMQIEKDRFAEAAGVLKQQLQKIQLSIRPTASLPDSEVDRLRKEKTEATREATDLKQKLRVVDKMTENAKLTREREIGDSLKKEDGLSETITILRSQLEARDDAIQTAKSAHESEIDTMRTKEIRYIEDVETLEKRLQDSDKCASIACGSRRDVMRKEQEQAMNEIGKLKLQIKTTYKSRSAAQALRAGHRALIDQVLRSAQEGAEEALETKVPISVEDSKPSPEIIALNTIISKQRKQIDAQGSRLGALHIKTKESLAIADKELREGTMEDLYVQCVADLAPAIIDLKQANLAKGRLIRQIKDYITNSNPAKDLRTMSSITKAIARLESQERIGTQCTSQSQGVKASGQSMDVHPTSLIGRDTTPQNVSAGKKGKVAALGMREDNRKWDDARMAFGRHTLPHTTEAGAKMDRKRTGGVDSREKNDPTRGRKRDAELEPGEIEQSKEGRMRAWSGIYSPDKSRGQ